jgi:PrcB C-terminal
MKFWSSVGMLLGIGLMTACAAVPDKAPADDRQIPVAVLYTSTRCGMQAVGASADWIDEPADLELPGFQRGGSKGSPAMQWDPATEGVLRIGMGRQRTGGYTLELAAPTAHVRESTALIRVDWRTPRPGTLVTQALTSPCLFLKVPRQGIDMIRVIDQEGRIRAEVPVP